MLTHPITGAYRSLVPTATQPAILAWLILTEVHPPVAVSLGPAFSTVAPIVIHQLHAVSGSELAAWIGETLVDVPFTARPHESRWASAVKGSHLVHAGSTVVTRHLRTVVLVDFTQEALGAVGAGAAVSVDEVVTGAAVLTRHGRTLINVILAVHALVVEAHAARFFIRFE